MNIRQWLTTEHCLIGASLTRVLIGTHAIYSDLLHWTLRHEFWGTAAAWTWYDFVQSPGRFPLNLYQLSPNPIYFELVFHSGIAVAALYTLGWRTRLTSVLQWLWVVSLQDRNAYIADGGDNFIRLALFFLMFADPGRYFSLDALRRLPERPGLLPDMLAVLHNVGMFVLVAQYGMLYASTGLYKMMGEMWQQGTALYYILQVNAYSLPGRVDWFIKNPILVVLATYGTVFFELFWVALLIGNRWTRYALVAAGLIFHAGIGIYMGLVSFGWNMLSAYPVLLADGEYLAATAWVRRHFGLTVFYDGHCLLCTRSVHRLRRLDVLSLMEFVSFRDPEVTRSHQFDRTRAEHRMQSVGQGKVAEGIDTMIRIAGRSVVLWPLVPVMFLCRLTSGQRVYDAIASRRYAPVPGRCGDRQCT